MAKYGIEVKAPTSRVIGARIFGKNTDYIYQVIHHIKPKGDNFENFVTLTLKKRVGDNLIDQASVVLAGVKTAKVSFSLDGTIFAYLYENKKRRMINVAKVSSDPLSLIENIEKD